MNTTIFVDIENFVKFANSPEKTLFLTVILQALLDASKPETANESEQAKYDRDRSIAWFFASIGTTASDFEVVCDMAGIDATYTREFASKILRTKEIKYVRKKINAILSS